MEEKAELINERTEIASSLRVNGKHCGLTSCKQNVLSCEIFYQHRSQLLLMQGEDGNNKTRTIRSVFLNLSTN